MTSLRARQRGYLDAMLNPVLTVRRIVNRRFEWLTELDAFTLIEMVLVVGIILTLLAIALPQWREAVDKARVARATGDIRTIQNDLAVLDAQGRLPPTLAGIGRANMEDPWGNPYVYNPFSLSGRGGVGSARKDRFLVPINSTYDLYSMGKDGRTASALTSARGKDDIIRANDGGYIGLASRY